MLKLKLYLSLNRVLKKIGLTEPIIYNIEHPADNAHGDYSSNIALAIFSSSKRKTQSSKPQLKAQEFGTPMELAEEIVDAIIHDPQFMIQFEKVEAVKPGFINFWLTKKFLLNDLVRIEQERGGYGFSDRLRNKKIIVEFTDPNPFKEFHIGHLYSNVIGESISRLLEALGANLKRANYQGDVGMHVAKAIYGIQNSKLGIQSRNEKGLGNKIKFLGQCYAIGAKNYEASGKARKEIEQLNKKIYAKDPDLMGIYAKGRQWSLEYFETIYKRLGAKFDFYYFESEVGQNGLNLVKEYFKKGIFEKSNGAIIFPGKKENLHDRVFVNSLGLPTYEAKELGLALKKYQDFKFDQSIVITGNEIIGYFKVLLAALGKINPEIAVKTKHLPHGMIRLPTGKISSRTGNVVTGEWLLDEAKKLLKSKYNKMTEGALEKVAVGAVKYALLKNSLGHDIEFNFEESVNLQGNSGPYLQYTFARTQSVINKSHPEFVSGSSAGRQATLKSEKMLKQFQHDIPLEIEEVSLLRTLYRFPEVIEQAGRNFAPNLLCNYLFNLAQKFNFFYQKHKIIGSEQANFRLALAQAVGKIIKTGLNLLGIASPEKI